MSKISSSFTKNLTDGTIIERIIRPYIHTYPHNFAFCLESNKNYYNTYNFYKVINSSSKLNTEPIIFYLQMNINNLTPNIFEIKITNKINIEWLLSALPHFFNPSKFKTTYLLYDNQLIPYLKQYHKSTWERICNKIANSNFLQNIPFDGIQNVKFNDSYLEILSLYIKSLKTQLLNY